MTARVPRVRYDSDADVLYISTQPGERGIAKESLPGVLWRYSPNSGSIVGVTIIKFSGYWDAHIDALIDDLEHHLHIGHGKVKRLLDVKH